MSDPYNPGAPTPPPSAPGAPQGGYAPPPPPQPNGWGQGQPPAPQGGCQGGGQPGGSSAGLEPKIANLISYFFLGLGGLIMYLTQKDNPEVRFHGAQSLLTGIALVAINIVLTVLTLVFGNINGLGIIASILGFLGGLLFFLGATVLWIFLMIQGYGEKHFKVPIIGSYAESMASK